MKMTKVLDIVDRRWDYYYLKKQLERNRKETIYNIIAGSSYGIFGLNPIENSVNFALPSQDFYYAIRLVNKAINENLNVRKVYLCFGFYSAYCNLSKSKEQSRIDDVYYPLLHDEHDRKKSVTDYNVNEKKLKLWLKKIITIIINFSLSAFFKWNNVYFDRRIHTRERRKLAMWKDESKTWGQLSENVRKSAAIRRASAHEKQLKYVESLKENLMCLRKLYQTCQGKKIELYFLNFPFSREYLEGMNSSYKEATEKVAKQIRLYCDKYIDINTIYTFETLDFVDCDHLSDDGAQKITQIFEEKMCIQT